MQKINKDPKLYKLSQILVEQGTDFDAKSIEERFSTLDKDPQTRLRFVTDAKAIFGFVKFLMGYYAVVITSTSKVGKIGEHCIYKVEKVKIIPLFIYEKAYLEEENKYFTCFRNFEINKQIYFSVSVIIFE